MNRLREYVQELFEENEDLNIDIPRTILPVITKEQVRAATKRLKTSKFPDWQNTLNTTRYHPFPNISVPLKKTISNLNFICSCYPLHPAEVRELVPTVQEQTGQLTEQPRWRQLTSIIYVKKRLTGRCWGSQVGVNSLNVAVFGVQKRSVEYLWQWVNLFEGWFSQTYSLFLLYSKTP